MIYRFASGAIAAALLLVPALAEDKLEPPHPLTRIAFGSCANQEKDQPVWSSVMAYQPELFVFAGDNVYGDVEDKKMVKDEARLPGLLASAYTKASQNAAWIKLRETVPVLATWDDHDFGLNDAGADYVNKADSQRQFAEFWKLPADDARRTRPGVYHAQTFGPEGKRVQVILLDTRYFRSPLKLTDQRDAPGKERYLPDEDPAKTMLGAEQWAWLEERLKEPAELRLIVTSIQVASDGHGWEKWGNFPRERQKLYDLVIKSKAQRVLLMSGDKHHAGIYRETGGVPYPLYEITSSSLNIPSRGISEAGAKRLGAIYGATNFGTIDIDWWAGEVMLSVRAVNGEPVRRQTVRFSEIETPPG
jgi:alkaline phosphatase D